MIFIYVIAGIVGLIIALILFLWAYHNLKYPFLRKKEPGFQYVCVEEDGSVREVSMEEQKYLTTKFAPTDGARPYIKFNYKERTPDGRLSGFIDRRHVPKSITIQTLNSPPNALIQRP